MNKKTLFAVTTVSYLLFTACIGGDEEPMNTMQSPFTIHQTTGGVVLYMDGGSVVYPTQTSVNDITNNKGFGDVKRAVLQFQYDETMVTDNGNNTATIRNAVLIGGNGIPTFNALTKEEAREKNVLEEDSIFGFNDLTKSNIWFSRGFLTISYNSTYYSNVNGGYHIPTANAIIEADPANQRNIDITLLLNKHTKKGDRAVGNATIINSFDITNFAHLFPSSGFDSISCNVHYKLETGMTEEEKTVVKNAAVKDFFYPW